MKSFRMVLLTCVNNFRKWGHSYRIICIAIILLLLSHMFTSELRLVVMDTGIKITPWIFPFLCKGGYVKLLFLFPILLLFCDAPFIDHNQQYIIIRMGRVKWCFSQLLYIVISSAIYFAYIIFISIVVNIQYIKYDPDWGKILYTMAGTDAASQYGLKYNISQEIIDYFTPMQAMLFSFFLSWMVGIFLGLLIFMMNAIMDIHNIGIFMASAFLLLDMAKGNITNGEKIIWLSPVSWNNLTNIRLGNNQSLPSFNWVIGILVAVYVCFIIVSVIGFRKKTINVLEYM